MKARTATILIYCAASFPLVFAFEHFMTAIDDWQGADVRLDGGMWIPYEPMPHPIRHAALVSTAIVHVGAVIAVLSVLVERKLSRSSSAPVELSWGLWIVALCELMFLPYSMQYVLASVGLM